MFTVFNIKVVTVATFDVVRSNASIGQGGGPECCTVREIQRETERRGGRYVILKNLLTGQSIQTDADAASFRKLDLIMYILM
jgi:hypothetical protein